MNFDPKKTIFLIDGSSFLYRAYYSMRPLHTAGGVPVQAVYGFCRMIKKLMDIFSPAYMVLVWDSKGKTTRHEMFQEYKATRQAPPSDLFEQKKYIIQFAEAIGLKQISQAGIEADDILFSIAQERIKEGETAVFITSDKDMSQALGEHILIYDSFKEKILTAKKFEEENRFPVEKLPFYFSLLGDASDNIPGVKGIGKTGAGNLVREFDSLEDLYANLSRVDNKRVKTALQENRENAFLSEKLFLLQYHPTTLTKADCAFDISNWSKARLLFLELNFKSLVQDMGTAVSSKVPLDPMKALPDYTFTVITTKQQLNELCAQLIEHKAFAMDTETTGIDPFQDPCIGISVCYKEGQAYYIPFGHVTGEPQLSREEVVHALKPIMENPAYEKYLHNIKFDELVLLQLGIQLNGATMDTMVVASLLTPEWQRNGLKPLSLHYFQEQMLSFDDVVKAAKLKDFSQVGLAVATRYAAADAHQTFKLFKRLSKELALEKTLTELYRSIEHPLINVLVKMEARGIAINLEELKELDTKVSARLHEIEQEIGVVLGVEHAGINLNSPRQVEDLLFVKLMLPPQKKNVSGSYSTDNEVLQALTPLHPIPALIIQYRELAKLKSTYINALPSYVDPKTGTIHTTYNQVSVATGRLASSDPNLQNIPADTGSFGIEVRAAFKPGPGYVFLSADYSQIELRVLAHLSGDKNLINAFLQGHDIHAETASRLFDIPLNLVTHDQRQIGKRINFSILYGLTPYGLSKDLGITYKDAKTYIDKYFSQYPDVLVWMESVIDDTKKNSYVETLWGRRRYIPGIYESNKPLYEEARRVAINTRAQGTAAEIMKKGMITLDEQLETANLDAHLVLQIHDELLIAVRTDQQEEVRALVQSVLERVVSWKIPLQVTMRFGADWKEVTK